MTQENPVPQPPRTPPRRISDDIEPFDPNGGKEDRGRGKKMTMGGGKDGMGQYIITAVICVVVVFMLNFAGVVGIKADELNKTLESISADIRLSKDTDTAIKTSVTTLTNQVAGMTSSAAASAQSIAAQNSKIDNAVNQGNSLASQISGYNSQISAANAAIAKLQADMANKSDANAVKVPPELQKQVDTNTATLVELKKQIEDINKKIAANPTQTVNPITGVTTSGASHTYQGVTATLTNLYGSGINGIPLISFSVPTPSGGGATSVTITNPGSGYPANTTVQLNIVGSNGQDAICYASITPQGTVSTATPIVVSHQGTGYSNQGTVALIGGGGSGAMGIVTANTLNAGITSQTVTLQVTNNNATAINNLQMVMGLAIVDSNGNPVSSLPSWMTPGQNIAVSSGGFGTSWTYQSVVSPNIWTFSNTASSNPFGLGSISLAAGQTQTFTQTIQVSNSMGNVGGTVYIYPIIRVVSFTG